MIYMGYDMIIYDLYDVTAGTDRLEYFT